MSWTTKKLLSSYPETATAVRFPLGGIGTGNVSVSSRGSFEDWEVFNGPAKGRKLPFSFFALHVRTRGGESYTRVIEAPVQAPFVQSHGLHPGAVAGVPHMEHAELYGEYPLVEVSFSDAALPVRVILEAFTPLVPLDADASGIPGAVIRYYVENTSGQAVTCSVVGSLPNVCGLKHGGKFERFFLSADVHNTIHQEGGVTGLHLTTDAPTESLEYGSMALLTTSPNPTYKAEWLPSHWVDHVQDFWDDFSADGVLEPQSKMENDPGAFAATEQYRVGSVGSVQEISPGERRPFEFVLAWHRPNRPGCWETRDFKGDSCCSTTRKNHYATRFDSAWGAASYLVENLPALEEQTRAFHRSLFSSTLPIEVLDAVAANISALRSTTCFRLEDGTLLGWEGCHDDSGCCAGSCTHVWNYAQTAAFLFPELERSMRRVEFKAETNDSGEMKFRSMSLLDDQPWEMLPATDGQLGTIVRLCREWKLSGDDDFLRELWPMAKRALEFSISYWDSDRDGVLDSKQHNTYDIEFFGPNSLSNSVFFAALLAGARMADYLGEKEAATHYAELASRGSARMDELLWNGEYYQQDLSDVDEHRYQYGSGCLSDQLFGQFLAHVASLGYVLPREHVKSAMAAVHRYNLKQDVGTVASVQRIYALPGEPGLLLCTWPRGGRPRIPFVYSDEVWTGIEYQVASGLIFEGLVEEGLDIVRAARSRHDGYRRNPWNEVECGNHYARSMSSWGLLIALSGIAIDLPAGRVQVAPRINGDNFHCFFSTGKSWGIVHHTVDTAGNASVRWEVLYGDPPHSPLPIEGR